MGGYEESDGVDHGLGLGGLVLEVLRTDVLSTQSTSDPDVVNGINESIRNS